MNIKILDKDSAAGFVVTGRSSSFYMEGCELSYNAGWSESRKEHVSKLYEYDYKYNLSAIKPLWDILCTTFDTTNNETIAGFFQENNILIAQGQKEFDKSGNAEDQDGNTPLHIAVQYNRVENAKEILFFGADKHYKNKEGISPRDLALKEFGAIKRLFEDDDEEDKVLGL